MFFVFLLQQDSLSLTEDSGISESCDDTEEAILTKMKLLARDLEQKLSLDSNLVQEIAQVSTKCRLKDWLCINFEHVSHSSAQLGTQLIDKHCLEMFAFLLCR